jgi:transposase
VTARPLDAARDALSTLHGQLIALLAARVAELEAANATLAERMARLERAASRNSGNSSMPPSADDLPGRTPPPPRSRKARRRPGKQPGAPGSHLAWSEHPDDTVPHFPQRACGCGRDLAAAADLGVVASHQEIEIPLAAARVIQHELHEVACVCGAVHRTPPPPGAGTPGTVTYSVQLQAWCVFLIAAHHVPCAALRS